MTGEVRPARLRISLTPPLTAVAQDAEEAAISISALLSADVHRGRSLARAAWQALRLSDHERAGLLHAVEGIEAADIIAQGKPAAEQLNRAGTRLDKAAEKMGPVGEGRSIEARAVALLMRG